MKVFELSRAILFGTTAAFLLSELAVAAPTGPLRVSAKNPRYFTDATGKAIFLTGSHTWNNLQDLGPMSPPPAFDFGKYLDFLEGHGHNFIRLWRWELLTWNTAANQEKESRIHYTWPHPWLRTGPGLALDGKPRFDLEQFDPVYFERLRARVTAARERDIYVSIMLFEGWGLRFAPGGWKAHPFHPANNIHGLESEAKASWKGGELFTLASPRITSLQEAYVHQVIDTVNDLDNVLFEIANESDFSTTDWQYHWIRQIKSYETKKANQHPVGMTSIGYGVDDLDRLLKSPADWISPNPDRDDYKAHPPAAEGGKVILVDTDHLWGVGGDVAWAWKSFLRGLNPIFMDPYKRDILDLGSEEAMELVRRALGVARRLAERVHLVSMSPHSELASTGYCLADPGKEYIVYLPSGGEASVDLSATPVELRVEWIRPTVGPSRPAGSIKGGDKVVLKAPFPGDAVLYLRRN